MPCDGTTRAVILGCVGCDRGGQYGLCRLSLRRRHGTNQVQQVILSAGDLPELPKNLQARGVKPGTCQCDTRGTQMA